MFRFTRLSRSAGLRLLSSKVFPSATEAVADITSGSVVGFGGFGLCGIPENLIAALVKSGPK